jgi:ATP-dependent protease ClpP protease subunit
MKHGQDLIMNGEIILSGYVVRDGDAPWFAEEATGYFCPQLVREALSNVTGAATIRLSSDGGDPFAGEAIRAMIAGHPGGVTVIVEGIAASAASLLFMGAASRQMTEGSMLMIHDPSTMAWGTEDELMKQASVMGQLANVYAAVYGRAAAMTTEAARKIMKAETWFSADEAIAAGFADSIASVQQIPADQAAMSLDAARAQFSRMTRTMVAMAARKSSATADQSAAAGGSPAALAMSQETVMSEQTPAAVTAATQIHGGTTMITPAQSPELAVQAERTRQRDIRQMAQPFIASMALTTVQVEAEIDAGTSVADASSRFMSLMAAAQPAMSRAPATIVRDEVDTRRTAMQAALVAQMQGAAPAHESARLYMSLSIAEMAATASGYKGSLRTAGDRIEALMAASHSTSDFTGIFESALNKALLDRYQVMEPSYRKIARKKSFNDFRAHPMVRAGDFPNLLPVGEGGEIKFGTFGEKRETAILSPYAVGLSITRQMMVNDEMGAIGDLINDYGSRIAVFEEATFYSFMSSAVLASDGLAVWLAAATRGATAAGNFTSTGTAISVTSLGIGQAAMRKQTGIDGAKLNLRPKILLVGPDKEIEASQFVTQITPALGSSVNPFAGKLEVVTSAEVSGNNWYLFADPNMPGGQCFVYGYLNGAEAPRLRTDEPFGVQGWSMTLEHDFGLGAVDFRGTYKNNGA